MQVLPVCSNRISFKISVTRVYDEVTIKLSTMKMFTCYFTRCNCFCHFFAVYLMLIIAGTILLNMTKHQVSALRYDLKS